MSVAASVPEHERVVDDVKGVTVEPLTTVVEAVDCSFKEPDVEIVQNFSTTWVAVLISSDLDDWVLKDHVSHRMRVEAESLVLTDSVVFCSSFSISFWASFTRSVRSLLALLMTSRGRLFVTPVTAVSAVLAAQLKKPKRPLQPPPPPPIT